MNELCVYSFGSIEITPELQGEIGKKVQQDVKNIVMVPSTWSEIVEQKIRAGKSLFNLHVLLFHRSANETMMVARVTKILCSDGTATVVFMTVDGGWDRSARKFIHTLTTSVF